jgi:hypothetical protein
VLASGQGSFKRDRPEGHGVRRDGARRLSGRRISIRKAARRRRSEDTQRNLARGPLSSRQSGSGANAAYLVNEADLAP